MPTRFVHLVIDAIDVPMIAGFWSRLLGWRMIPDDDEFDVTDETSLTLVFVPVAEPKTVKNRMHLDLASTSATHQDEVVTKAIDLGARRLDIGQDQVPWVVLADPEGNEFCVLEPRPGYPGGQQPGQVAAMVLDCAEPAMLVPFYSAAMGWPVVSWDGDGATLRPADGRGPWLELVRVSEPKQVKHRVHLDVAPFAGQDQGAEVARLLELGARRTDVGQGEVPWVVLADPEGNELCVLSPR